MAVKGKRVGSIGWVAVALALASGAPLAAQAPPRYHPLQLECARYRQEVRSVIELESRGVRSREETLRDGILVLRATPRDSAIALEAWFDSLTAWREGAGERLVPETDGLLGGRYHGLLATTGAFTALDRPFIPDDLAQVADLGDALAELLPELPATALAPGAGGRDPFGTVVLRLPDGTRDARRVQRYRLTRALARDEQHPLPDSTSVLARREEHETGVFEWSPEVGLVRWERTIQVVVEVPAGGPVRQPFRTRIQQQVTVERLGSPASCR